MTSTRFRKFDHLEKLGHSKVFNIEIGTVYVFPKIDGTNASIWWDTETDTIQAGSRTRVLSLDNDNAGFLAWVVSDDLLAVMIRAFCKARPNLILYGEWLVPHSLKTYRQEAWRNFWIFDVYDRSAKGYLHYETYSTMLDFADVRNVIEPMCIFNDPSHDQLKRQAETNTYLLEANAGVGEGCVFKNYEWRKSGYPWAKFVRPEFKEENRRAFGTPVKNGEFQVEVAIAEEFVTPALVNKTRAKTRLDVFNGLSPADQIRLNKLDAMHPGPGMEEFIEAEYRGRIIPQLLGRVFHDLVDEEMIAILKKHRSATIDFGKLQSRVTIQVKKLAEDLFS